MPGKDDRGSDFVVDYGLELSDVQPWIAYSGLSHALSTLYYLQK